MSQKKKLIEVALPLQAINDACKPETENPFLRRHPRALSVWWARAPLVACRAVLFASLVDDPSSNPDLFPTGEDQEQERQRLFAILEKVARWDSSFDSAALNVATKEIRKSIGNESLKMLDPFAGRGSIPLEGQRLGLEAFGSDLNPIAALITKSLLELPPRFRGSRPVNSESNSSLRLETSPGNEGLIADIGYYAGWIHEAATKRLSSIYPPVRIAGEGERAAIAWIWARSLKCPNPGCGAVVPLVRSFQLSKKQQRWVQPVVDQDLRTVSFRISDSEGSAKGTVSRKGATCIVCAAPLPFSIIRQVGEGGDLGKVLLAIVGNGDKGPAYIDPVSNHVATSESAVSDWIPDTELTGKAAVNVPL